MNIDHRVAQLLVSRVCHDLAGGVSALSTGAELLSEDTTMADAEALDVIAMSAAQCASRLAFFRIAFGLGGGENDTITTDELKALVVNFVQGGRISVEWGVQNARISLDAGKILLNLCLIGTESLPRGGVVYVEAAEMGPQLGFAVSAQGAGAGLRPGMEDAFLAKMDGEALNARTVHGYFTQVLAKAQGAELEYLPAGEDKIHLAALL